MAATLVQSSYNLNTGGDTIGLNGIAAGNLVVAIMFGTGSNNDYDTADGSLNGSYTRAANNHIAPDNPTGNNVSIFYKYNSSSGNETITFDQPASWKSHWIGEYSGVKSSADPLLDSGGAQGTGTISDSLTLSADALVILAAFNYDTDLAASLTGVTLVTHQSDSGYSNFVVADDTEVTTASSPLTVGTTTNGSSGNVMACAAFELAASGTTAAPGVCSDVDTCFAPTVSISNNQSASPDVCNDLDTGFAPTISISNNISIEVGLCSDIDAGFSPTIDISNNQSVSPNVCDDIDSCFAPVVDISNHISISPGLCYDYDDLFAPTVSISTGEAEVFPGVCEDTDICYAPVVRIRYVGSVIGAAPSGSSIITSGPAFGSSIISSQSIDNSIIEP